MRSGCRVDWWTWCWRTCPDTVEQVGRRYRCVCRIWCSLQTVPPPCGVRRWLHLQMYQLVGRCTWHRAFLRLGLDAIQDSGTDRDCLRTVCHGDLFPKRLWTGCSSRKQEWPIRHNRWGAAGCDLQSMSHSLQVRPPSQSWVVDSVPTFKRISGSFIRSRKISKVSAFVIRLGSSRYLPQQLQELW